MGKLTREEIFELLIIRPDHSLRWTHLFQRLHLKHEDIPKATFKTTLLRKLNALIREKYLVKEKVSHKNRLYKIPPHQINSVKQILRMANSNSRESAVFTLDGLLSTMENEFIQTGNFKSFEQNIDFALGSVRNVLLRNVKQSSEGEYTH
jgi:hypothetical protein